MKKRRDFDQMFSASVLCYIILLIISLVLIAVSLFFTAMNPILKDILRNFGYGIFGSTFVAVLVDLGSTKRQRNNDQKAFLVLSRDFKDAIENLLFLRGKFNHILGEKYEQIPYRKWLMKIATVRLKSDDCEEPFLTIIKRNYEVLYKAADLLNRKSSILATNLCVPKDFIHNLDELILYTRYAIDFLESEFSISTAFMIVNIIKLFPEYHDDFLGTWDASMNSKWK